MLTGSALVKDRALALAQPVSALLELTYRCPCRCLFCFNPRRTDTEPLSASEWIDLLDDLRALGTLSVTLTGGEPMSRPDFLTIAEAVTKRAFSLYVLTNGVLLDDAMARELGRIRPFAVEVSLHGASAEVHDAARSLLGVLLVPMGLPLWSATLGNVHRLCREVPAYRMEWRPDAPSWEAIEGLVG